MGPGFSAAGYSIFAVYLTTMLALAVRGALFKKKAKGRGGEDEELEAHFLAGQSFSPGVIFLNFCAQYIGGIVMVGVPDDTKNLGFFTLMWISGCAYCGGAMMIFIPRLREVYMQRHYISPNDFITDRYASKSINFLGSAVGIFQLLMVSCFEWLALKRVINSIACDSTNPLGTCKDGAIDRSNELGVNCSISGEAAVWFLAGFVYFCELLGGMSSAAAGHSKPDCLGRWAPLAQRPRPSFYRPRTFLVAGVAITDAIQAFLLLFSFLMMPVLATYFWGGFNGIGGPRCANRKEYFTFGQPPAHAATATDACYDGFEACAPACAGGPPTAAQCARSGAALRSNPRLILLITRPVCRAGAAEIMPNVWFPTSMLVGFLNVDHTFTGLLPQTCCPPGLWNGSTAACAATGCPPDGTRFLAGEYNVTLAHEVANASYGGEAVAANENGIMYSGMLQFVDGTSAYTNEPMMHTQRGCLTINQQTFWFYKREEGQKRWPSRNRSAARLPCLLWAAPLHEFAAPLGGHSEGGGGSSGSRLPKISCRPLLLLVLRSFYTELTVLMFTFGFSWVPFGLSPITLHRVMTSKTTDGLRCASIRLTTAWSDRPAMVGLIWLAGTHSEHCISSPLRSFCP